MSAHEIGIGYTFLTSTLTGDSTLTSLATGGVWRALAPDGVAPPFVVMQYQAGSDATTMNGYRLIVAATYQVKVVGPASLSASLLTGAARLDALLGGTTPVRNVVLSNGIVLSCYPISPLFSDELVNGEHWSTIGLLCRMELQATA